MTKRALILGVGGQDGSYIADILLEKGYEVHGVHRHTSSGNLERVRHLLDRPDFHLHRGDLGDVGSLYRVVSCSMPEELYNEADQDNVGWSHALPGLAARLTFAAVADVLEIVRQVVPECRVFQPCSSTMFGNAPPPQNEDTPFNPLSPYAVSKVAAYHLCRMYRQVHGLHVSTGILFNHTSVRQTDEYLLHKICKGAVRIARGEQNTLPLGNLETLVDIGCAREYMEAAWLMLQQDQPGDYCLATGTSHDIGEFVTIAFTVAGVIGNYWGRITEDPKFWTDKPGVETLGNSGKAYRGLGWQPNRTAAGLIPELVRYYQRRGGV